MGQPNKANRPLGLGTFVPPPDTREVVRLETVGERLSFDQLVARLNNDGSCIRLRVMRPGGRVRRGRATEVDESGIVRVEHLDDNRRGVYFLLSQKDGRVLGEFTD